MQDLPLPIVCERCNLAEAVIHRTVVRNGVPTKHHYCAACAVALGAAVIAVPVHDPLEPDAP